jgi:hypothetical protein
MDQTITAAAEISSFSLDGNGHEATVEWSPGVGATKYWLTMGTSAGGSDLSNSLNIGTDDLKQTVYNIPAGTHTIYTTLYTRIENNWYATSRSDVVSRNDLQETIPASFRTCITITGQTCTLPAGTYYFGPGMNAPIVVGADGVTIQGLNPEGTGSAAPRVVLARMGTTHLKTAAGCADIISIQGRSSVKVKNLFIDGGGLSGARDCVETTNPTNPNSSFFGQPESVEIHVTAGTVSTTSDLKMQNLTMRNAIGRAITVTGTNQANGDLYHQPIAGLTIEDSKFIDAQLTGILIHWNNSYNKWLPQYAAPGTATTTANGCDSIYASPAAARVPSGVVIQRNKFRGHWTGTIALNPPVGTLITNNEFYQNYDERSWDGAGGTIYDAECVEGSIWDNNLFDNSQISTGVNTSAFEFKGHGKLGSPAKIPVYGSVRKYDHRRQPYRCCRSPWYFDPECGWLQRIRGNQRLREYDHEYYVG